MILKRVYCFECGEDLNRVTSETGVVDFCPECDEKIERYFQKQNEDFERRVMNYQELMQELEDLDQLEKTMLAMI